VRRMEKGDLIEDNGLYCINPTSFLEVAHMQVYSQMQSFFKEVAATWRKTQIVNLTILASAILSCRSLTLAELARAYPRKQRCKV
jgi:hypothetical protein